MLVMLLAAAALAAAPMPVPVDYGAPVAYAESVRIGEAFVREDLADPDSAKFKWPFSFVAFSEKVPMFKRTTGYATCLTYNAKNAYGAYVGYRQYRITIRNGNVIDFAKVSDLRFVPDICKELVDKFGMVAAPVGNP